MALPGGRRSSIPLRFVTKAIKIDYGIYTVFSRRDHGVIPGGASTDQLGDAWPPNAHISLFKIKGLAYPTMMFSTRAMLQPPSSMEAYGTDAPFWLAMRRASRQQWFMAKFLGADVSGRFCETVCTPSDINLIRRIEAFPRERLEQVTCWMPTRSGGNFRWESRRVGSIWRGMYKAREVFVFKDVFGCEHCCDRSVHVVEDVLSRRLVVSITNTPIPA